MNESILRIPTLSSELITEILSRLPVKSLLKFTAVSKSWLDLISSSEFIKSHLNLSANNKDNTHHRFMWCHYEDYNVKSDATEASYFNFPMKKPQQHIHSINHVNGLFFVDWSNNLFLWNPSIRKYKKLPHSTTNSRDVMYVIYGFGYDKFCDDYKVVACTYYNGQYPYDTEVHIYSLKSDSWRNIHCLDQKRDFIENSGKFVNGKIYWVNDDSSDPNIFFIDLVDEKLEKMEQLCNWNNMAVIFVAMLRENVCHLWVMKKSWTKISTIKYDYSLFSHVLPFFMSNKGEIVVGFASTNIMIYNPKDDSLCLAAIDFNNSENYCCYAEICCAGKFTLKT